MVKVDVNKYNYYLDGIHKNNLDIMKKEIKNDWDFITAYDGPEGSGKSTKCIQDHLYLDPTLDLKRVTFSSEEFEKAIVNADKYQAVIYDEAITGLYSREAMKYVNTSLTKLLAQIRQKNLFIGIILPSFFDLDKYVAMWRSRVLVHIYTNKMQRGFFKFFSYYNKKNLYVNGKKFYNYNCVKSDFGGRFTKFNPWLKEYNKKKYEALKKAQAKTLNPYAQRDKLIQFMYSNLGVKQNVIAGILGMGQQTISHIVNSSIV